MSNKVGGGWNQPVKIVLLLGDKNDEEDEGMQFGSLKKIHAITGWWFHF